MSELTSKDIQDIHCAADIIRGSKKVVVLTGAGISTPSGIPDFRSADSGLWEKYDPFEVASLNAFRYQPENFFTWLRPLALTMRAALPNPAHFALARLEQAGYIQTIVTQNIDALHTRAGSRNVLEVHGSLQTLTCIGCYHQFPSSSFIETYLEQGVLPRCPECQNILKPDVVLFGEQLPVRTLLKARQSSQNCDLMIVAGSSLEVLPVAGLPMSAVEGGAHLIIINHTRTYIDVRADLRFPQNVAVVLPHIADEVLGG